MNRQGAMSPHSRKLVSSLNPPFYVYGKFSRFDTKPTQFESIASFSHSRQVSTVTILCLRQQDTLPVHFKILKIPSLAGIAKGA